MPPAIMLFSALLSTIIQQHILCRNVRDAGLPHYSSLGDDGGGYVSERGDVEVVSFLRFVEVQLGNFDTKMLLIVDRCFYI